MSNKVRRNVIYWIALLVQFITAMGICNEIGFVNYSWLMVLYLLLIHITGAAIIMVTVGRHKEFQKFFGHDLKKECECPPTKMNDMPTIKKDNSSKDLG